jgi:hypothetical protein
VSAGQRTATCACGEASITLQGEPTMHAVCHCTNCKRRTGSAFGISAYFRRDAVVHTTGQTAVYAFHHAGQNHHQSRHFCARCGTTLYWTISTLPDSIGVAAGCFADDELPAPTLSVTHGKKVPWVDLIGDWKRSD